MSIQSLDVASLLPHRAPMVLLSEVLEVTPTGARTRTRIGEHTSLFEAPDGSVSASILIELMAQSVGVYAGRRAREAGLPPKIGFLLGTRRLTTTLSRLERGSCVDVDVDCVFLSADGSLPSQFACRAALNGQQIGCANLTVYQPDDPEQLPISD
ncbi:MAG: 3-hydroxylacyl-ACP dehydratase [Duodenibacillus sp.]